MEKDVERERGRTIVEKKDEKMRKREEARVGPREVRDEGRSHSRGTILLKIYLPRRVLQEYRVTVAINFICSTMFSLRYSLCYRVNWLSPRKSTGKHYGNFLNAAWVADKFSHIYFEN